uniref:TBC1 domain family member 12-like n=1 Tax=Sinocyclocheilus anshuiensis TaxID=1608454 RepID=A0A671KMN1_9TELE
MFSHTGTSQGEKGQLQSIQDHEVPESCDKTNTQPCGTKLPNGHGGHSAHKLTEWDNPNSSLPAGSYLNSEGDHVIANGELSAGSRGGALDAISSVLPPQDAAVDRTTSSEDCLNAQNAVFNDTRSCSEGDPSLDRNSSASPSTPKHSLRTFSSSTFLNTDSARLSPDDDETFSTSDRPDDSIFTDLMLLSQKNWLVHLQLFLCIVSAVFSGFDMLCDDIFGRSLFSRKQREAQSAAGWKLFGKVPLRESPPKDSKTIQQEYEARASKSDQSPSLPAQGRRKNLEFEPLSTTALILEDRPASLPAKSEEEAQRHRQEYDEMVAEAKKRELKEAQKKKKQMKERFKQEESIANAMVVWNNEILPNWESMRGTRRVRDLWWQGLPPNVRGKVWSLAIGNELNITSDLYEIFLSRAKERWKSFRETGSEMESDADSADRESSLDLIKLDISRTFPPLFIFQKVFFEENLPRLFNHFKSYNLTPDLYLIDWIFTLYTKSLPLDVACRVWDVFCRDGEEFLFRTGLGILGLYEDVLLQMDFIHIAQFLTRLPEDTPSERLLSCIANTQMISSNRKWAQVFNALIKDKEMEKSSSPTVKNS